MQIVFSDGNLHDMADIFLEKNIINLSFAEFRLMIHFNLFFFL